MNTTRLLNIIGEERNEGLGEGVAEYEFRPDDDDLQGAIRANSHQENDDLPWE
jgi:hypothetical protein